jgi:hypothetical protein
MGLTNDDSLFEFGDQPQRAGHRRNKVSGVFEEGMLVENEHRTLQALRLKCIAKLCSCDVKPCSPP